MNQVWKSFLLSMGCMTWSPNQNKCSQDIACTTESCPYRYIHPLRMVGNFWIRRYSCRLCTSEERYTLKIQVGRRYPWHMGCKCLIQVRSKCSRDIACRSENGLCRYICQLRKACRFQIHRCSCRLCMLVEQSTPKIRGTRMCLLSRECKNWLRNWNKC
jgi:hypothetical protein